MAQDFNKTTLVTMCATCFYIRYGFMVFGLGIVSCRKMLLSKNNWPLNWTLRGLGVGWRVTYRWFDYEETPKDARTKAPQRE